MDVSIAVSLIRGQMGAVVERAVNGAVETVLAEMLRVVGVKFEELKAQVASLKRDMTALQREKALKEKENDKIRAMLRYTELKLKYYRQGVEEEMQQRASSSSQIKAHPSQHASFSQTPRGNLAVSPSTVLLAPAQIRTLSDTSQGNSSSQSRSKAGARVSLQPADGSVAPAGSPLLSSELSDLVLPQSDDSDRLCVQPTTVQLSRPAESKQPSTEVLSSCVEHGAAAQGKEDVAGEYDWTVDPNLALGPPSGPGVVSMCAVASLSPDRSTQADSSTLASNAAPSQMKQEEPGEEVEVICIKEEPEEEREVMVSLLQDYQMQQGHIPASEGQRSSTLWSNPQAGQGHLPLGHSTAITAAGSSSYVVSQHGAALPSIMISRQAPRPRPKDLSLYEEYKLRRNEIRKRSISRRREMEKSLPQPLLADLVRERREKTRLRVARWRAKRKLQACLSQTQAQGGAADFTQQQVYDITAQQLQQQLRTSCAPASQTQTNAFLATNTMALPFIAPSSSSSSSLLLLGHMTDHINQHTVTSSSHPSVSLAQQNMSLTDTDVFQ
ncbi:uncharacterized protein si:ch211-67e16.4 isoform X2 [Lampris incognitus]|uniref:uncharacterized protein si:ch211-67e16.4 isoform X2 n=1 Tax=Lampris incognitus TaxID=2546036 RepID=UPI0024B4848C|nr:uncharacterized protein si:ch211-67e16.4 isoform X2 [Lampris incognitus]